MARQTNLEHCLRQKLTSMENSIARIYSIKSQLRNSAEQARKDISNAIDHQLSCVRAREQELLFQLEQIMAKKEQKLCEQQEQLNKAIGACQQSLECILRNAANTDAMNVQNSLLKMNAIDLRPRESPNILFEFDPSDLRRSISTFGRLTADERPKAQESLPLDVEHYHEDDVLLSHKSVLRLHPTSPNFQISSKSAKQNLVNSKSVPFSESINFWLSQMKTPVTTLEGEKEIDCLRDRIASLSGSSFEVVSSPSDFNQNSTEPTQPFDIHFSEINRLPADFWLKKDSDMLGNPLIEDEESQISTAKQDLSKLMKQVKLEDLSSNDNKRKRTVETRQVMNECQDRIPQDNTVTDFEFEKVIRSIQLSDDDNWLLVQQNCSPPSDVLPHAVLQTSHSAENVLYNPNILLEKSRSTSSEDDVQMKKKKCFWDSQDERGSAQRSSDVTRRANECTEQLDTWENVLEIAGKDSCVWRRYVVVSRVSKMGKELI
ncbi:nuclear receptor coactivator 4 [Ditylenchus destructor]|nr:nuclear receptor coactivator 4 [Ditylenchus destructor]